MNLINYGPGISKLVLLLLTTVLCSVHCTLFPEKGNNKQTKELKSLSGPQDNDVFERNLVQDEEPSARSILINHAAYSKDTQVKNFNSTVLGYVTPWNSHGYDVAKIFIKKFNIISPVWLQLIKENEDYRLKGEHDVDATWMRDLRKKSRTESGMTVKIFPRLIFEQFSQRDYSHLLSIEEERKKLNEVIIRACKQHGFDGIVLEIWSQLAGHVDDEFLYTLILDLSKALQRNNYRLILVIPPFRGERFNVFKDKHLEKLYKDVYAFSLMTYDYSNVQRPGANAPLDWIRKCILNLVPDSSFDVKSKRRKILMGLNMYGNDYTPEGGGAIVGNQYLELLKHVKKRLSYDDSSVENYFEIRTNTGRHYVFYPTLFSINERIKLANELGVGISIWELGQGLDYFYDLF